MMKSLYENLVVPTPLAMMVRVSQFCKQRKDHHPIGKYSKMHMNYLEAVRKRSMFHNHPFIRQ